MNLLTEEEICNIISVQLKRFNPQQETDMLGRFEERHAGNLERVRKTNKCIKWVDGLVVNIQQLNQNKRNDITIRSKDAIIIFEVKTKGYLFAWLNKKLTSANVHKQLLGYALRQSAYIEKTKKLQLLVVMPEDFKIPNTQKLHNLGIDVSNHKQATTDFVNLVCSDVAERVKGSGVQIQSRVIFYKNEEDITFKKEHSQLINY